VAALPELLASVDLRAWSLGVRTLRDQLIAVLRDHGLKARPSDANWVLVATRGLRARLAPLGVVVRDCTSFGMPDLVRIAVPTSGGLEQLAEALTTINQSAPHDAAHSRPLPPHLLPHARRKGAS
jgi:histidinol-phosphate/aromatic aminotransferase/cobyric acid decarboxylase-like protein